MRVLAFLVAALYSVMLAAAGPGANFQHGLARVESTYATSQLQRPVNGTGIIFSASDPNGRSHLLLLTASHVSGGGLLRVNDQLLSAEKILSRRRDIDHDLELIELPPDFAEPMGIWAARARRVYLSRSQLEKTMQTSAPFNKADHPGYLLADHRTAQPDFVLRGDWIHGNGEGYRTEIPYESQVSGDVKGKWSLQRLLFTDQLFSVARIANGMSGSPLVGLVDFLEDAGRWKGHSIFTVLGLAVSYWRNAVGSFYASDTQIANLVERHLQGLSASSPEGAWQVRSCLLYRAYPGDIAEMALGSSPSGGHSGTDGGESLQCANERVSRELQGVAGGMHWKGRDIQALQIGSATVFADLGVMTFLSLVHDTPCADPKPLDADADFVDLLRRKLRRSGIRLSDDSQLKSNLNNRLSVRIGREQLIFKLSFSRHGLAEPLSMDQEPDDLAFRLNRRGEQVDARGTVLAPFTGFIRLQVGSRIYTVDLRSLFFFELQRARTEEIISPAIVPAHDGRAMCDLLQDRYRTEGAVITVNRENGEQLVTRFDLAP